MSDRTQPGSGQQTPADDGFSMTDAYALVTGQPAPPEPKDPADMTAEDFYAHITRKANRW